MLSFLFIVMNYKYNIRNDNDNFIDEVIEMKLFFRFDRLDF